MKFQFHLGCVHLYILTMIDLSIVMQILNIFGSKVGPESVTVRLCVSMNEYIFKKFSSAFDVAFARRVAQEYRHKHTT